MSKQTTFSLATELINCPNTVADPDLELGKGGEVVCSNDFSSLIGFVFTQNKGALPPTPLPR